MNNAELNVNNAELNAELKTEQLDAPAHVISTRDQFQSIHSIP